MNKVAEYLWASRLALALILLGTIVSAAWGDERVEAAPVSWTTPVQAAASVGWPTVRVRSSDGDVGLTVAGANGAAFVDSAHTYKLVSLGGSSQSGHTGGTFDAGGTYHAVWQDRDYNTGRFNLFYARIAPDLTKTGSVNLTAVLKQGAGGFPSIIATNNKLFIAYEESNNDVSIIESDDGGNNWLNHFIIGNAGQAGVSNPQIAVDSANRLHVVFISHSNVFAADRDSNGKWASPVQINNLGTPGGRALYPAIAATSGGDVFAVWGEDAPNAFGTGEVSIVRRDHNQQKWQPESQNISRSSQGGLSAATPGITADSNNTVWVAWRTSRQQNVFGAQFVTSSDNGQSYSQPADAIGLSFARGGNAPSSLAFGNGNIYYAAQLSGNDGIFGAWVASTPVMGSPPPGTSPSGCVLPSWATGAVVPGANNQLPASNSPFYNLWARYDFYAAGKRSYVWGATPFASGNEPYYEATNNAAQTTKSRSVLYWDKSRMEVTHANNSPTSAGYVTNGLLTVELVTGRLQVGDNQFVQCPTANVPVAGDSDDTLGPRYASFAPRLNDAATAVGTPINQTIAPDGGLGTNGALASIYHVTGGYYEPLTKHTIASVFWDFLNQSNQQIWTGPNTSTTGKLFDPYYLAPGLPISEAYWAKVKVGGQPKDVLIQAFERRILTYTPSNSDPFKVEWGNIGRHYYQWRYHQSV